MFVIEREAKPGEWVRGIDYFWNERPAIAVAKRSADRWKQNHRVVAYPDASCFTELVPYVPPPAIDAAALAKEIFG